jgi:hypothetical protein
VRVSRRTFIVTERRENRVSACVGLVAVTVCLIFAVITERLERVCWSLVLTDTTVQVINRGR